MDDSNVILFGSFTEDEVKSLQKKPSGTNIGLADKKEFQFGTLTFVTETSSGGVLGKSSKQPVSSVNHAKVVSEDDVVDSSLNSKELVIGPVVAPKENGSIHVADHLPPVSVVINDTKVDNLDLASLRVLQNEASSSTQVTVVDVDVSEGGSTNGKQLNATHQEAEVINVSYGHMKNAINGSIVPISDLLPRGLINSGNLCFLNATLQSLLACSPFVELLKELRLRDIPKVGYPTLNAFVDFLSVIGMPSGSSLKEKESSIVLTGTPFSPTMFEGVLKNFTPDIPNGMFGRPRQEDAQEFLSFVMNRMHDELLKLGGQFSDANGIYSSVTYTQEDDEWETVGPKNKSAITRTQSFVPSELSAIFGGQLRSVVKARENTRGISFPLSSATIESRRGLRPLSNATIESRRDPSPLSNAIIESRKDPSPLSNATTESRRDPSSLSNATTESRRGPSLLFKSKVLCSNSFISQLF
ncbi:hypothetical protein Droror1_Dr00007839 [Drosera rotundifolia]